MFAKMNTNEIDLYKNFIINKIKNSKLNVESVGDGITFLNENSTNNVKFKSITGSDTVTIIDNGDELIFSSLQNIQPGLGNRILVLDNNDEIKYMKYEKVYGSIFFNGNSIITPLTMDIWADVVTSGYTLSDDRSGILDSSIVDGSINIDAVEDFVGILLCNIVLENTQNGFRIYQIGIFLNEVLIEGSQVMNEVNQRMNEITTQTIITLMSGDKVKIMVRNLTNDNDCRVTNLHFSLIKLDNKI